MQEAAKLGDISAGLAAYDAATARSIPIISNVYDILMYLCAGGDDWDTDFRRRLVALPSLPHKTHKGEGSTAIHWQEGGRLLWCQVASGAGLQCAGLSCLGHSRLTKLSRAPAQASLTGDWAVAPIVAPEVAAVCYTFPGVEGRRATEASCIWCLDCSRLAQAAEWWHRCHWHRLAIRVAEPSSRWMAS